MESRNSLRERLLQKKSYRIMRIIIVVLAAFMVIWNLTHSDRGTTNPSDNQFVSVEIRCDALLEDPESVDESIREYIPEDGIILKSIDYQIRPGKTTVFDITNQVCQDYNIQIEYTYTPGYGGYYVEGINYIYEFSAGKDSGWMYMVDGVSPSYGADKMTLNGGEKIVWYYTTTYSE